MTDCFGLFYISESKNHGFVFEKQIKVEDCQFGLVGNIKEPAVSMKHLAKNPQLEKFSF